MPKNCAAIVIAAKHGELIKVKDYSGIANTVGALRCKFEFRTSDWDNATMTAVFCKGNMATHPNIVDNAIGVLLDDDDECAVPAEVLTQDAKYFSVGVWGVTANNLRIVSEWLVFRIKDGCYVDSTQPIDPTPTVYEQLIEIAENAEKIAQSVRDDADNGKFIGEKGEKGDEGAFTLIPITVFPTENIDKSAIYLKPIASWIGSSQAWTSGPKTITTDGFKNIVSDISYFRIVVKKNDDSIITPSTFPEGVLTLVTATGLTEYPAMEQGTIDGEAIHTQVKTRIYTRDYLFATEYKEIRIAEGYSMWAHFYNGDRFEEYIYINERWELIGSTTLSVNLAGYAKKTDLNDYVKKTDYADTNIAGVVKLSNYNGVSRTQDGTLRIYPASLTDINNRHKHNRNPYRPITTDYLDEAVIAAISYNARQLYIEEHHSACEWLHAVHEDTFNETLGDLEALLGGI